MQTRRKLSLNLLYKTLLFLPILMGIQHLYAQKQGQARIDSLLQALPKAKEDTNKVILLYKLSFTYYSINPGEGIKYGDSSMELATKLNWDKGIASASNNLGVNYQFMAKNDKALECYQNALKFYQRIGDENGIARVTGNIGIIYQALSNYPKALEYYEKAINLYGKTGNKNAIVNNIENIGMVYAYQSDYPKALEYFFRALKLYEEAQDKNGVARITGNIGHFYSAQHDSAKALEYFLRALKMHEENGDKNGIGRINMDIGDLYAAGPDKLKAIQYFFKALKIHEEIGNKEGIATVAANIGAIYLKQEKYDSALYYTSVSLKIAEEISNKYLIAGDWANTGDIYVAIAAKSKEADKSANLQKAIDSYKKSISLAREIGNMDVLKDVLKNLSDAQASSGDYNDALANYRESVVIKDSIFSNDNKVKIANQGTQRAEELNQKQIEINKIMETKKHNEQVFFISGIAVLMFIIFIIFRNNKLLSFEKKKSDNLLLNILPEEVADELKAKGTADAKLFDSVTVLFTDFVGFTTAGQRMTPQQLVGELHACFKGFDEILSKYKIEKIKTVGDAYLAVSGLPGSNPDHATEIVAAAIEIRDFMLKRQKELGDATFGIRLGVNSGSVVAGIVGVKKFAYDIWGDTVNTAARMEQNSEAGKINVSQSTYELIMNKFTCVYRGEIAAKNKGELKMYFVA